MDHKRVYEILGVIWIIFWIPVGHKCHHSATGGLCKCVTVLVYLSVLIWFTCMHLLLAGYETVPISMWLGGCVHSVDCRLDKSAFSAFLW